MSKKLWFAVINPCSANGKTGKNWPVYYEKLKEQGIKVECVFTSRPGEAEKITREALMEKYGKIIAVGGDGTVNEVINGFFHNDKLVNAEAELAVFEHGTGSDFIRSLYFPQGIDNFICLLKREQKRLVDIGKVNYTDKHGNTKTRYFINAANVGIGAETVNRVNSKSKFLGSKPTYFLGAVATIFSYKNNHLICRVDEKTIIEHKVCGIMICNGQYIGGGMHIAPHAKLDDGLFDIIVIKDITKLKLLFNFPLIYKGEHLKVPDIEFYRGKMVSIASEDYLLEIDGEVPGKTPAELCVFPKILKIWT